LWDYAYCYRNLPDLASLCRLDSDVFYSGKNSLKLVGVLGKNEKGEQEKITGFCEAEDIVLKPETCYKLTYYLKIIERVDNGERAQAVSISLNFHDKDKNKLHPKNYGLNRLQCAYSTGSHKQEDYLNKWVKVEYTKTTPPETAYGKVTIGMGLTGTAYVDDVVVRELRSAQPVTVETGEPVRF